MLLIYYMQSGCPDLYAHATAECIVTGVAGVVFTMALDCPHMRLKPSKPLSVTVQWSVTELNTYLYCIWMAKFTTPIRLLNNK